MLPNENHADAEASAPLSAVLFYLKPGVCVV